MKTSVEKTTTTASQTYGSTFEWHTSLDQDERNITFDCIISHRSKPLEAYFHLRDLWASLWSSRVSSIAQVFKSCGETLGTLVTSSGFTPHTFSVSIWLIFFVTFTLSRSREKKYPYVEHTSFFRWLHTYRWDSPAVRQQQALLLTVSYQSASMWHLRLQSAVINEAVLWNLAKFHHFHSTF